MKNDFEIRRQKFNFKFYTYEHRIRKTIRRLNWQNYQQRRLYSGKGSAIKRGIESLLKAEMTTHLGFDKGDTPITDNTRNGFSEKTIKTQNGEQRIKIPRDREARFEPVIVPKHQPISQELEDCIQLLCKRHE